MTFVTGCMTEQGKQNSTLLNEKKVLYFHEALYSLYNLPCSTQHSTTYIKKLIEDSSTMDERIRMERFQFLAVGQYSQHATYSLFAYGHMLATTVMHLMNSIYLLFLLFPTSLFSLFSLSLPPLCSFQFCSWENWPFSMIVINELLLEVSIDKKACGTYVSVM